MRPVRDGKAGGNINKKEVGACWIVSGVIFNIGMTVIFGFFGIQVGMLGCVGGIAMGVKTFLDA
jgi:hypothetical protein